MSVIDTIMVIEYKVSQVTLIGAVTLYPSVRRLIRQGRIACYVHVSGKGIPIVGCFASLPPSLGDDGDA